MDMTQDRDYPLGDDDGPTEPEPVEYPDAAFAALGYEPARRRAYHHAEERDRKQAHRWKPVPDDARPDDYPF